MNCRVHFICRDGGGKLFPVLQKDLSAVGRSRMGQQSFVVAVEGGRVDCEGLFGGLQESPEGGRLVNSEGLKVGKVSATCFAHGVPVRSACSCCLLCSSTMGPTSGVKVVQSLVA